MDISDSEYQVMEAIWQGHPCTATDVVSRLNESEQWHEKTVKTLIGRLVKKEALSFEKQGRQYVYSTTLKKSDYQIEKSQSFLSKMFDGKISPLVAAFANKDALDAKDISELKDIINNWEQDHD
ncbi:MAG: BlaI/MecI/CopY family transcriptional regulator [Psychrosphaera sp.]|nr:BlaI/MecI/CopY family transcriptional regulator [Psychrosphaera sp.]